MDELQHYGILGMKWGIRRTPEELGHKNISKAKTSNFNKWGKSPETNTLYISGYSGSGKSTAARSIAYPEDTVIHLDLYSDEVSSGAGARNSRFEKHLDRTIPKWRSISTASETSKDLKLYSKAYWKLVDDFADEIERYSANEYKQGRRVIVEGIQIADGWLHNIDFYSGKPVAIMQTNKAKSLKQAFERDERTDIGTAIKSLFAQDSTNWSKAMDKNLSDLEKVTFAKKNDDFVNDYLKYYGERRMR